MMKTVGDRFVLAEGEPRLGGMAEIYRAVDIRDGLKAVAVKFVTTSRIRDDRIVREAFARELAALNKLDHPNIVRIVDFDARNDPPYLVIEWLEHDLEQHLASMPTLGWGDFYSRIGRPLLNALVYAFTKQVIHRDLKPGNILVDGDGTVKIADFGIAKLALTPIPAGGATLAGFKSEPYAPMDDASGPASRDPYSYCVLCLRCMADSDFKSHEDVANALACFSGPLDVKEIFARALSADVMLRFADVLQLQTVLDKAQTQASAASLETCYISVRPAAVSKLCERLGDSNEGRIRRRLERDITESFVLLFWLDPTTGRKVEGQFLGRSSEFRLHLAIDDRTRDRLVVLSAWPDDSEEHEARAASGYRPNFSLAFGRTPADVDGVAQLERLVELLTQHELDNADARRDRKGEALFREWAATLRFRQAVEGHRYAPIRYDKYRVDGNRVYFSISALPDGVFVDQPRVVLWDQRTAVAGLIDEIGPSHISLWVEHGASNALPERGELILDNRASRIAIDRQKSALDAVRYGRCLRPSLRDFILNPAAVAAPRPLAEPSWAHPEFDEDKKAAVRKALGATDIVVVQGPPGTGKTRFVTELVVQLLRRSPECKILLTSQTHVALDNALERIHLLQPDASLLRVAQREDGRVSPNVRELTIENVAHRWQLDVAKASETFLSTIAKELGVDRKDIALGMAAGRLRAESSELDRVEGLLADCERRAQEAELELAGARAGHVADKYHETTEALEELREQLRDLAEQRKVLGAKKREASRHLAAISDLGGQLAELPSGELAEWERGLLAGSEADKKCHALIQLAEEWQLRFANSREFYAAMVATSSVVAGTCLGFARIPGMLSAEFDVCVVDEASKATATELLVPLSRAKRWILVGDTRQLPPFVEDLLDDRDKLREHELDRESFETTLLDRFAQSLPNANIASLTTQHRMTRAIGDLISACFYEGALKSVRDEKTSRLAAALPAPVTWFTTAKLADREESAQGGAVKNVVEARFIGQWLKRLNLVARAAGKQLRVAVIAGYAGQCLELNRTLDRIQHEVPALILECNTVDAFQGREADICVYSVTRSNSRGVIGFLRDARRMNVALSRGRSGLVIVGDHVFCRDARNPNPLRTVLDYIDAHPSDCKVEEAKL